MFIAGNLEMQIKRRELKLFITLLSYIIAVEIMVLALHFLRNKILVHLLLLTCSFLLVDFQKESSLFI